jgi:hypothetical protein
MKDNIACRIEKGPKLKIERLLCTEELISTRE